MPDESLKTYQEVIDYLKEKRKKDKKRRINLLFGNGFSMAFNPDIFSYNALSNYVQNIKDKTAKEIFDIVGTTNFEEVMRNLELFIRIGKKLAPDFNYEEKVSLVKQLLKDSLIEAITNLHPKHVFEVPSSRSQTCALFLKDYLDSAGSIFSTNYDLLLYWVLMRESGIFNNNLYDGFSRGDNTDLTWESGSQNIFYLHGSLPLFDMGHCIIKEEYTNEQYLLDKIKKRINNDQYPIFVTAGTVEEKMKIIFHNRYLSYCYNSLENLRGSLVVIGFNFGEYDTHIIDAINRAATKKSLCSLFIGYYTEEDRTHLLEICKKIKLPKEKIRLFNSKTANIWGNAPQ